MAFGIGGGMRPVGPVQRAPGISGPTLSERTPAVPMGGGSGLESFKRGGKVKKTGLVKAEKGERVLTKKQQHARSEKKMSKH